MMLRNSSEIPCCCPFCCLGDVEPGKLSLFVLIWDMFLLFSWFVYNMAMIDYVTIAPLILNFGYILFMFVVLWDLREPNGQFTIVKYYSYFRIALAVVMTMFALVCFILMFVFIANSSLQGNVLSLNWAIAFFFFFTPASVIQWGTIYSLHKALRILQTAPMNDISANSRFSGGRGNYGAMRQFRP